MDNDNTVRDELSVMRRIVTALDSLEPAVRPRVVAYLTARYGCEHEPKTASKEITP
jgi:hypothetical protein